MDQPLKARLIGATVLVVLAVLLIPELLSGRRADDTRAGDPASSENRTFTIEIGRSGGTMTAPAATRPLPAPSPTAAPGAGMADAVPPSVASAGETTGSRSPEAGTGVMAQATPPSPDGPSLASARPLSGAATAAPVGSAASAPQASATSLPPASAGHSGQYFVQVGAFSSVDAARKLVGRLEADGYPTQVAPVTRAGKTLHRVRVGPAASRAEAQQLAERLKARGLPASLVTSD